MFGPRSPDPDSDWSDPKAVSRYELDRLNRRIDDLFGFLIVFLAFVIATMILLVAKLG